MLASVVFTSQAHVVDTVVGWVARELIHKRTRTAFREHMVGYTLREISDLFEGEGIAYSPVVPNLSGQRRSLVEQYYATVDWANPFDVNRVLRGRALPRAASVMG